MENFDYTTITLSEINKIKDDKLRLNYLKEYKLYFKELKKRGKFIQEGIINYEGYSIAYIEESIQNDLYNHISKLIFPGDRVYIYNKDIYRKNRIEYTCPFCSSIIEPGNESITYNPFIYNSTKKVTYVLERTFKVDNYCDHFLPKNIRDFEEMILCMEHSYEMEQAYGCINYYELLTNIKEAFVLKKHRRKIK